MKFSRFFPIFLSSLIFSGNFAFSQENSVQNQNNQNQENSAESESPENPTEFKDSAFFLTAGPMLMLNTDSETDSAPSPVMYSMGFGYSFRKDKKIAGEARLSFFTNYYLWDGDDAQIAEVENRTATALSFLLDATAGRVWRKGANEISVSGGLGVLARIALLSSGVSEDEAGDDVSSINSWFYSNANFLFPEFAVSYLRSFQDFLGSTKIGGEFRTYICIGSIIAGDILDSMIFSLSAKIQF